MDFGIYLTSVDATAPAPNTTTRELSLLSNPRLVRKTAAIPALHKTSFGLRYRLIGVSEGEAVNVVDVITTPGIKRPDSDDPVSFVEKRSDVAFGERLMFTGYTFDNRWEAVPGEWTIEIWHADQLLVSKVFRVVPARQLRN